MAHQDSPGRTWVNLRPKDNLLWVHRPALDDSPPWKEIIARIRDFQPVLLRSFPSIVAELAQAMLDLDEPPMDSLRGVSCSSEDLLPTQRAVIERAFGVRCFGFYGQSEGCVLAMECAASATYHLYPGYAFVEIVDEAGRPIHAPGEVGEVVGISLLNYAMPLIRYRTGDLAARDAGGCRWNNGSGVNDSRGGGGGMLWRIYRAARETPLDENGGNGNAKPNTICTCPLLYTVSDGRLLYPDKAVMSHVAPPVFALAECSMKTVICVPVLVKIVNLSGPAWLLRLQHQIRRVFLTLRSAVLLICRNTVLRLCVILH